MLSSDFRHRALVMKVRHVRTPAGERKFKLPIGSPIPEGMGLVSQIRRPVHVNRSTKITRTSAGILAAAAMAGGFTFDTRSGEVPTKGYVVGIQGRSSIRPATTKEDCVDQIIKFFDQKDRPSDVIGGWHDTDNNEIALDFVNIYDDPDYAYTQGVANKQQAIYDLEHQREIDTGGSGDKRDY